MVYFRAFCKIGADILTGRTDKCNIIHSDGSGTKSTLAYLHYRETGDPTGFRKTAQDSLVMNIDDLLWSARLTAFLFPPQLTATPEQFLAKYRANSSPAPRNSLTLFVNTELASTAAAAKRQTLGTDRHCYRRFLRGRRHGSRDVIDNAKIKPGLAIVGPPRLAKPITKHSKIRHR